MFFTLNHRDIMSNILYHLVHLVGRLLKVRALRDSCVTVCGACVETTRMLSLRGTFDMDRGPRAIIHFTFLYSALVYTSSPCLLCCTFYFVATSAPRVLSPMTPVRESLNTSYQKLPFGSGDYPDTW